MVYIVLGNGFEEMEAVIPCDMLRRAGIPVQFAAIGSLNVLGNRGITIQADISVEEINENELEMIVLPGGLGGVQSISHCKTVLDIVRRAWDSGKYIAAICAAPTILAKLGITDAKPVTCYPGMEEQMKSAVMMNNTKVVVHSKLITAQAAGSAFAFAAALITALKGETIATQVTDGIVL